MKKAILFVLGLILLSVITNAKDNETGFSMRLKKNAQNGTCFDEHTHLINMGIGFGGGNYYRLGLGLGYVSRTSPAFSVTYEQAWPKKLGPGYLGVGAYAGFMTSYSRYNDYYYFGERYYYEHRWNYMLLTTRGVYHWDVLNTKNAEVYGGMLIGFRITTYNYQTNSSDPDKDAYKRSDEGLSPIGSVFAGARWYFLPNMAVFGEAGYGISYVTGGITFKW